MRRSPPFTNLGCGIRQKRARQAAPLRPKSRARAASGTSGSGVPGGKSRRDAGATRTSATEPTLDKPRMWHPGKEGAASSAPTAEIESRQKRARQAAAVRPKSRVRAASGTSGSGVPGGKSRRDAGATRARATEATFHKPKMWHPGKEGAASSAPTAEIESREKPGAASSGLADEIEGTRGQRDQWPRSCRKSRRDAGATRAATEETRA